MINSFFTLLPFLSQLPATSIYIIYYINIFSYNFDFAFSVSVAQVINSKRKNKDSKKKRKEGKNPVPRNIYRIVNLEEEMGFDMGKSMGIECAKWV